jgi:hypothetical protein
MQLQDETQGGPLVETGEPDAVAIPGSVHGIWIALATFVPTFLAIFLGIPYLAGLPMTSRFPTGVHDSILAVLSSLTPVEGLIVAPPQGLGPTTPSTKVTGQLVGQGNEPPQVPSTSRREARAPAAAATTTPATSSRASHPPRPQVEEGKAAAPKRSASTVPEDRAWVRGAAFSDRLSAERLATSIKRQGYPAKVRQEAAPTTPWVVWIGKHPRGIASR